jgi:integrase
MITIKVKFRESTIKKKKGTIYYLLTRNKEYREITTPYKIHSHEWNEKRSIIAISNAEYQRRYELQLIENSIIRDIRHLQHILTSENNIDTIIKLFKKIQGESLLSVFSKSVTNDLYIKNQPRTAKSYIASVKSFLRFRNGVDISFEELTPKLISDYERYLKEQQICNNTISFYMRNLRAIYNRAVEESYTEQKHPFKKVFVGNDKTIKRAIDEDVISRFKTLDLSSKPRLAFSRDMFMFSFYARGMAFIDLAYLTKENIQGEYIIYRRHKTGQELSIKLEICLKTIIDRYSHYSNGTFLFPVLSESTQNYDSALRLHNIHLKKISGFMGLPKPLTSYVARHSWATLAKKKGISTQIISESMGHNSEKTTRIYLSSLDRSVIDDANAKLISGI